MTNVRRPINLQLQRPSTTMVSSSSGPSPFGAAAEGAGASRTGDTDAQQTPPQPAPRSTPIRPNALINFNCLAQSPTVSASPMLSPMPNLMMMPRSSTTTSQRPTCWSGSLISAAESNSTTTLSNYPHQSKALSPSSFNDSQPSSIMPHVFVGNLEQTNRETINKLNIKYILSLGLLPMIITNTGSSVVSLSPASPTAITKTPTRQTTAKDNHHNHPNHQHHYHHNQHHNQTTQNLMPSQNSSKDFKIRVRSNTPTTPTSPFPNHTHQTPQVVAATNSAPATSNPTSSQPKAQATPATAKKARDENKGVKQVRSIYCKCINIADNSDQLLGKFFDEAFMFIEEARKKKCNILIHCLAGISRSPTIAIAYLMRSRSLHWKDAYDMVKQCRPQIDPNLNFMGQLRIYNKSLRDDHTAALANKRKSGSSDKVGSDTRCHASIKNSNTTGCRSLELP